ncbi:MAG: hypothetical protein JOY71_10040 [Acetobacteraceae bacterium]|nr:hypothetical protein [Acetobacteraceae bacterium]MBV8522446.1 hypothetical protein [Acetobacteraceae bacterium]MBV8592197.1 hypothetical protein [Acetobacteraceae bacterium]
MKTTLLATALASFTVPLVALAAERPRSDNPAAVAGHETTCQRDESRPAGGLSVQPQ